MNLIQRTGWQLHILRRMDDAWEAMIACSPVYSCEMSGLLLTQCVTDFLWEESIQEDLKRAFPEFDVYCDSYSDYYRDQIPASAVAAWYSDSKEYFFEESVYRFVRKDFIEEETPMSYFPSTAKTGIEEHSLPCHRKSPADEKKDDDRQVLYIDCGLGDGCCYLLSQKSFHDSIQAFEKEHPGVNGRVYSHTVVHFIPRSADRLWVSYEEKETSGAEEDSLDIRWERPVNPECYDYWRLEDGIWRNRCEEAETL